MLDYWGFFPTEAPWGRLPAMGLSTVAESSNPDIEVGGPYFGFHPKSGELVIDAIATPVDSAGRPAPGDRRCVGPDLADGIETKVLEGGGHLVQEVIPEAYTGALVDWPGPPA